jgi:hypothetical protein
LNPTACAGGVAGVDSLARESSAISQFPCGARTRRARAALVLRCTNSFYHGEVKQNCCSAA